MALTLRNSRCRGATTKCTLVTYVAMDARGNVEEVTFGNGAETPRTFDLTTGSGATARTLRKEEFDYDYLGRLDSAATKLSGAVTASRSLDYAYGSGGNPMSKTSDGRRSAGWSTT